MKIKNEKEALQMFCENKGTIFDNPFINVMDNDRLMATDRKVMILVDNSLLQETYEAHSQRLPNFDTTENTDINIPFANIDKAFSQFELVPETIKIDGDIEKCPECDGTGLVDYTYFADNGRTYDKECDCPICDGTGTCRAQKIVETGRMVPSNFSYYQLNGVYFSAKLFNRVVEALRLMGFESMRFKSSKPAAPNKFIVCDGIELWIMPCANIDTKIAQIATL